MKKTIIMYTGSALLTSMLAFGVVLMPAFAHDGEDHSDEQGTEAREMTISEMEQMITLMQQLIVLLTTLRTMQPAVTSPASVAQEMEEHHDEHSVKNEDVDENHEADEAKLVIEIEPHNNQTHVHVRYVDKPEEMFFVDAGLNEEDRIVSETSSRTGLSQDEVREALKYMQ